MTGPDEIEVDAATLDRLAEIAARMLGVLEGESVTSIAVEIEGAVLTIRLEIER